MVHGCMVYTELAPRWLQFHVAPAMPALKYTTSMDIQKTRYKKLVTHVEPRIVQELCESRGGRPGLSVLTCLLVSVDIKIY